MSTAQDPQRRRLTVAMIVRDDADAMVRSIESIRSVADEIVVADTGSADDSVERANVAGAKVFSLVWGDDFSAARNACFSEASGDWVLWLDAGETLSAASAKRLREFVDGEANPGQAYLAMIESPPARGHASA